MLEKVLDYLNREISAADDELDEMLESRGLDNNSTFEDLGRDSDGIPNSAGNSDDVYSDGIRYGTKQGSFNSLLKIKSFVEALEE